MSTSSNSHHTSPSSSPKQSSPTTPKSTTSNSSTSTSTTQDHHITPISTPQSSTHISSSPTKAQAAVESLSTILPSRLSVSSSPSACFLLTSPDVSTQISTLLRHPSSGSGDNHLCRWLYDTFQSCDPSLQLVVLRFFPLISGLYLTRITQRQPLAGFEAVLLALYAHETTSRNGQAMSVTVPDLSNPSIYHENIVGLRNNSTDLNIAVISSSLEPHGTVRSTRRARIVGVAMELFYSKIWVMPIESKLDFCEFLDVWAGQNGEMYNDGNANKNNNNNKKTNDDGDGDMKGRIPLPWELLQPCLRILGHCLLGEDSKKGELYEKACKACRSLYARAMHDVNSKAILAIGSLLRITKMYNNVGLDDIDHTEIHPTRVISI